MRISEKTLRLEAEIIAKKAGKILLSYRKKFKIKQRKTDFIDIVTSADLAAEKFIINAIKNRFSHHNILSEEAGEHIFQSDYTWVIDPLDGTRQFARGLTFYNVSIAIEYKGEIIVGVVYAPSTNELFSTAKNQEATLNNHKLHVSEEGDLKNSLLWIRPAHYKNSPKELKLNLSLIHNLTPKINRFQPFTEDVKALCGVAQGGIEAFIIALKGPKWWDVAPGILMVEETGGKVTDFYGNSIKNRDLTKGLVASNGLIHDEILKIISSI